MLLVFQGPFNVIVQFPFDGSIVLVLDSINDVRVVDGILLCSLVGLRLFQRLFISLRVLLLDELPLQEILKQLCIQLASLVLGFAYGLVLNNQRKLLQYLVLEVGDLYQGGLAVKTFASGFVLVFFNRSCNILLDGLFKFLSKGLFLVLIEAALVF